VGGRATTKALGYGSRAGARLEFRAPPPADDEPYLETPSSSQLNSSIAALDDIMTDTDPYATPIILTTSPEGE
jgi:hypothetical protein